MILGRTASTQERVERRGRLDRGSAVKGFVPAGAIRLIGWDRDSIVITGVVGRGEKFFFGGGRGGVKFGVEDSAIDAESQPSYFDVYLPKTSQVSVKTVSGTIVAVDVSGWFYTVAGRIEISGRSREIEAEAMDGSVFVTAIARWVRARTASGQIRLSGNIEDAAASSVSGPISVSTAGLVRGQFGSVTGNILFTAALPDRGVFSFDNHSGSVELRLRPAAIGNFSITTVQGSIENGLVAFQPAGAPRGRPQSLGFRLGSGGSYVTIRTYKGTIILGRS
jgi:hypothetical protein